MVSVWVTEGAMMMWRCSTMKSKGADETWRAVQNLRGHVGDVYDLSWGNDGTRLASASIDNKIIVWVRAYLYQTSLRNAYSAIDRALCSSALSCLKRDILFFTP